MSHQEVLRLSRAWRADRNGWALRWLDRHEMRLLGDRVDDTVHQPAECPGAMGNETEMTEPDHADHAGDDRRVEDEGRCRERGIAAQHEGRQPGQPHLAAHAQQPLYSAVVLADDHYIGAAPQAARNLEVPVAPALVEHDEVFLRREKRHEAAEQELLLVAALTPLREKAGALAPIDARLLPGGVEPHLVVCL